MLHTVGNLGSRLARRGLTLIEVVVAIGIILVLLGGVLLTRGLVAASSHRTAARQQLMLIAQAIDQYAAFWPRWKVAGAVAAEGGWPDFIPGRLFQSTAFGGPFDEISGFNDHLTFDVEGGIARFHPQGENVDLVGLGDVLNASVCLAYGLTAASGQGPYVPADGTVFLKDIEDSGLLDGFQKLGQLVTQPLLPGFSGGGSAKRRQVVVDPWGTPYRYFWVYRDTEQNPSQRAYMGFLPVDYGAFLPGSGAGGVNNAAMFQPDGTRKTAAGYVLESAGPDRRFGNIWKVNPTLRETEDATDNVMINP